MEINRSPKSIWVEVNTFNLSNYDTLGSAFEALGQIVAQYGSNARINRKQHDYSDGYYDAIETERLETDQELAVRVAHEEKMAILREAQDRKTFDRLKAQFGK